jgi:hypothetical protein
MSIQTSRTIVRVAAVVTVLVCGSCLTRLAADIYGEFFRSAKTHNNIILFFLLWGVLPTWFIWESIRAWRFLPKSIESLSIIWALAGLSGVSYGTMLGFVEGWKIWSVVVIVIGLCIFLFGIWMTKQQKRLYDVA